VGEIIGAVAKVDGASEADDATAGGREGEEAALSVAKVGGPPRFDTIGTAGGCTEAERDLDGNRPGDGPDVPLAAASLAAFSKFMRFPDLEAVDEVDSARLG